MIFITSIYPTNDNIYQKRAIACLANLGYPIYSFNIKDEIEQLQHDYNGVRFITIKRSGQEIFGKPVPFINDIINFAVKQSEIFTIFNSDIQFSTDRDEIDRLEQKCKGGVIMIQRCDYKDNMSEVKPYSRGMDVFMISKEVVQYIPQNNFCLGIPTWDYWVPHHMAKENVPLFMYMEKIAFHKRHPQKWNGDQWRKSTGFWMMENVDDMDSIETTNAGVFSMSRALYFFLRTIPIYKKDI